MYHVSTTFRKYFLYARMASLKIKILISLLLLAIFMRTNRGLNWAYFTFNNHFRKYFRYAQMTSFIFETIIELSAAIRNVYAQLVLMNRGLNSTYTMLICMLLWDPLTYLFHWGTRVLVLFIICNWWHMARFRGVVSVAWRYVRHALYARRSRRTGSYRLYSFIQNRYFSNNK